MNNNEELIEEINDVMEEVGTNVNTTNTVNNTNTVVENQDNSINQTPTSLDNETTQASSEPESALDEEYISSKSKVPILVILSILLVIDIAALVIYIIGIDKVLSFIK